MESSGVTSIMRNRRLESYIDANSVSTVGESSKLESRSKEGEEQRMKTGGFVDVDDDSWSAIAISVVRIVICSLAMMFTTMVWALIMLVLLPWPYARIKQGNVYGHVTGWVLVAYSNHSMTWTSLGTIDLYASGYIFLWGSAIVYPEEYRCFWPS